MADLTFADSHDLVAYLEKSEANADFAEIVDFLNASPIRYALTVNPTIYVSYIEQFWSTAKTKTINIETQIHAKVDGKTAVITESSVQRDLHFNDEDEVGEGSRQPSEPQHIATTASPSHLEPFPYVASSSHPKKTHKHSKTKIKATEICHSSRPTTHVADETVHKERGDSVERTATTAASLDAEQANSNILRTQSTAIRHVPFPQGIGSGGSPRRQEIMGDTIAQTRSERVSTHSYDSLLLGVNTPGSDEERIKIKELMEMCTKLSDRVLDLENVKDAQALEIIKLKKRVKKLERKNKSRTSQPKTRVYKPRVESFEESLGAQEDASKQGRNDQDEGISFVQEDA
ncbi:hypothetical protein Tco_0646183 [Tanacetum coccineum]